MRLKTIMIVWVLFAVVLTAKAVVTHDPVTDLQARYELLVKQQATLDGQQTALAEKWSAYFADEVKFNKANGLSVRQQAIVKPGYQRRPVYSK